MHKICHPFLHWPLTLYHAITPFPSCAQGFVILRNLAFLILIGVHPAPKCAMHLTNTEHYDSQVLQPAKIHAVSAYTWTYLLAALAGVYHTLTRDGGRGHKCRFCKGLVDKERNHIERQLVPLEIRKGRLGPLSLRTVHCDEWIFIIHNLPAIPVREWGW